MANQLIAYLYSNEYYSYVMTGKYPLIILHPPRHLVIKRPDELGVIVESDIAESDKE